MGWPLVRTKTRATSREQLEDGSLHLVRADELRDLIRSREKRLIAKHAEALAMLDGHDRGDPSPDA
jgi:hypothetical protein